MSDDDFLPWPDPPSPSYAGFVAGLILIVIVVLNIVLPESG